MRVDQIRTTVAHMYANKYAQPVLIRSVLDLNHLLTQAEHPTSTDLFTYQAEHSSDCYR